jgi:two-component system chemotaxis response regulator CheY
MDGTMPNTAPVTTKPEATEQVRPTGELEPVDRPIRVLIADDHAMVRQGLCGLLAAYGNIQVVGEAADGEEAVTLTIQLQPDVVLMDVNMPQMDGLTFLKHLKNAPNYKFTPVIMLTTESQESKKAEGRAAGARAWITKPFQPSQLVDAVNRLCV